MYGGAAIVVLSSVEIKSIIILKYKFQLLIHKQMNQIKFDLTLTWLIPIVVLVAIGLAQNHYKNLRDHRDDLVAGWLNCAEGHTMRVFINKDYVDVQCQPIYPHAKRAPRKR